MARHSPPERVVPQDAVPLESVHAADEMETGPKWFRGGVAGSPFAWALEKSRTKRAISLSGIRIGR